MFLLRGKKRSCFSAELDAVAAEMEKRRRDAKEKKDSMRCVYFDHTTCFFVLWRVCEVR